MVSVLDSRTNALGSVPGRGHCVVFLGKTSNPGGSRNIPSCLIMLMLIDQDKLQPNEPLGSYEDFTFTIYSSSTVISALSL